MEWIKKKAAKQELDKAEKRIAKLDSLEQERVKLNDDISSLKEKNSFTCKEIAELSAIKKEHLEHLGFENNRLKSLSILRQCQLSAIQQQKQKLSLEEQYSSTLAAQEEERIQVESTKGDAQREWIAQIPALDGQIKFFSAEMDRILPTLAQAKQSMEQSKKMLDHQYNESINTRQAIERFDKRAMMMQQLLVSIFKALYSFRAKIQEKFNVFERNERWKTLMNNMAEAADNVQVNKLVPDYQDPYFDWPIIASVTAQRFTLSNTPTDVNRMELLLMSEPYALGTFRCAYYAKDRISGLTYTVKHFHLQRGGEQDLADCKKVSKAYSFAKACASIFQNELFRAQRERFSQMGNNAENLVNHIFDIHSITFIDSYFAQVRPFWKSCDPNAPVTAIMIEPDLPDFFKWFNNDMEDRYADESNLHPHNNTLSAFMHWTYHRSSHKFIVADLQGYKCCVPLNITTDSLEVIVRNMFEIGETDTTMGERVIKWLLSDPAVHVLPGAQDVSDALSYDFDGNLGAQAETFFKERHSCNDVCELLRLPLQ